MTGNYGPDTCLPAPFSHSDLHLLSPKMAADFEGVPFPLIKRYGSAALASSRIRSLGAPWWYER